MIKRIQLVLITSLLILLNSCGAYFNQPLQQTPSRVGEFSKSTQNLLDLPEAADRVEVAVYNFSDQTGQYKPVENGSTFSTAVTQGATTILIKALEDSGYFLPIERENLSNLSTERSIIRNTKQEYIKNLNPNEPPLPPLLYAGLLLEGGIISYDTNIVTGGIGARYFGIGGSSKYRQDRITIYLRAVSTSNGEILKTVYVSKTILSQSLDASYFRFVKFQRLLEAETGITRNEPLQIAVKDAIEKAVHDLIIEGIKERFWSTKEGAETNNELVETYDKEKAQEESIELYNRILKKRTAKDNFTISGGTTLFDGDYTEKEPGFLARLEYQKKITKNLGFGLSSSIFKLDSGKQFSDIFSDANLNAYFNILPEDDLSPYIYAGGGMAFNVEQSTEPETDSFFKMQYGAGLKYYLSRRLGLKLFAEHNISFSDKLDGTINGTRNDFYYNFGLGLDYYFNF
ncbi:CsgG/HfaB family protein [Haloflavibacter putidus]|uniref:Outer membrane beta-barrel protein n=1 Tax=Haloflavibacter putidus TaxID=2576776 RepID=A0A507ZNN3_9FLAO|nr:CsgG/HfaB family protein [Haloflavibacter putidus]TQD38899.1 outer membrane beta-barrel protein [Haloflavibacter putidus]